MSAAYLKTCFPTRTNFKELQPWSLEAKKLVSACHKLLEVIRQEGLQQFLAHVRAVMAAEQNGPAQQPPLQHGIGQRPVSAVQGSPQEAPMEIEGNGM